MLVASIEVRLSASKLEAESEMQIEK